MTTIRITCPGCHTRCRLRLEPGKNPASHGKCPECGEVFPIPPGLRKDCEQEARARRMPRKLLLAGLLLLLPAAAFFFFNPAPSSAPGIPAADAPLAAPGRATETPAATGAPTATLRLDPALRSTVIARIKRHALVGDAGIAVDRNRYRLFLLVSRNTPPGYAEELGRQFAAYLENQLQKRSAPIPPLEVAVYYPGGARLEIARSRHDGEEEILPRAEPRQGHQPSLPAEPGSEELEFPAGKTGEQKTKAAEQTGTGYDGPPGKEPGTRGQE